MDASSTHPKEFSVYRWEKPNEELKETKIPWTDPAIGQVAIKVLACGICGT